MCAYFQYCQRVDQAPKGTGGYFVTTELGESFPTRTPSFYGLRRSPVSQPHQPRSRSAKTATAARVVQAPLAVIIRAAGAPVSPRELRLASGSCVIGAGSTADIIVEDKAVSRRHVELTLVPEGVRIRDLGSRNGTFYLGQRIESAILAPGSSIRVGQVELNIVPDPSGLAALDASESDYRGMIGASSVMRRLFALLTRLEGSLVNVLVEGPSGVGKELVARAIHDGSQVSAGRLIVVNCGAVAANLVLSELFGHVRGAFTGATEDRPGAFDLADGGTIFLDEIGEMPLDMQPALLRVLESGEVKPVGGGTARNVRVRVIAATNRDLQDLVKLGRFREDLYYRLAVVKLPVPSLSERPGDIPALATQLAREVGKQIPEGIVAQLASRQWQGNVRELRNAVHAYLAIGQLPEAGAVVGGLLEAALKRDVDLEAPYQEQKDIVTALFSRIYFEALLERTGGNRTEAARASGIERSYLSKLLTKFGVK